MCDLCDGTTFCQLNVCSDCKQGIDNMEQNFNSLQQLKADMKNVLFNHQDYSHTELVAIIEGWQRQLSALTTAKGLTF